MKLITLIIPFLLLLGSCQSGSSKEAKESCCADKKETSCRTSKAAESSAEITAYYFHYTKRCVTCNTVEEIAESVVKSKFDSLYVGGKIAFISLNLDEEKDAQLAKELNVDGQNLIIIKGDKQINLTNTAFMNARSNPEKYEAELVTAIQSLL